MIEEHEQESAYVDPLAHASNMEERERQSALKRQREASKPEQVQNPDGTWPIEECVDCGDEIGEARLALAKIRCIHCQTAKEKAAQWARR